MSESSCSRQELSSDTKYEWFQHQKKVVRAPARYKTHIQWPSHQGRRRQKWPHITPHEALHFVPMLQIDGRQPPKQVDIFGGGGGWEGKCPSKRFFVPPCIKWRDDTHNSITFIKKHIIYLIFCNWCCAAEAMRWHTIPWNIDMIFMD